MEPLSELTSPRIALAATPSEIEAVAPVMLQLRPHLTVAAFCEQVWLQFGEGYRLAYLESESVVRAAAGFRIQHHLAFGRFLYVDDLVTREEDRSKGYGAALFEWLVARAIEEGCKQLHLDSGVQRFDAHRFYLSQRMSITSHHFALDLTKAGN